MTDQTRAFEAGPEIGSGYTTTVAWGLLRAMVTGARRRLVEWQRRVQSRRELSTLSHRGLQDIACSRGEWEAEIRKPFWQR